MSNYDNLLRKKDAETNIDTSKQDKHWAVLATLLETGDTPLPKKNGRVIKFGKLFLGVALLTFVGFVGYKYATKKSSHSKESNATATSKVIAPFKNITIPYQTFTIDANIGDTLFTNNGSILIFPKNAVLYTDGTPVKGSIEIKTREFNDPIDFSFAGIPMTYDSAGKQYTFISSGMIDIAAYQNGKRLLVNKDAKPTLHLVSTNNNVNTNLYILDTITGKWLNKGKDDVTILSETNDRAKVNVPIAKASSPNILQSDFVQVKSKDSLIEVDYMLSEPEPPRKATGKNPVIEIKIDPNSFAELLVYDNMKFEVIGGDEWDAKESDVEWENVQLKKITEGKVYNVTFTKGEHKVSYLVNPVLESNDYNQALEQYNSKLKEYEDLKKQREIAEQEDKVQNELANRAANEEVVQQQKRNELVKEQNSIIAAENDKILTLNKLIALRNIEVEMENKRILEAQKRNRLYIDSLIRVNDSIAKVQLQQAQQERKRLDSLGNIFDAKKYNQESQQNMLRSFTIDGFGYWNCDQPTIPEGMIFVGNFKDEQGRDFTYNYMNAASYGVNRVLAYYDNQVTVLPNVNHIMWCFQNGSLYYLTFDAYKQLNITINTKNSIVPLQRYTGKATTVEALKKEIFYVKGYDKISNSK